MVGVAPYPISRQVHLVGYHREHKFTVFQIGEPPTVMWTAVLGNLKYGNALIAADEDQDINQYIEIMEQNARDTIDALLNLEAA